jgi:hypothetical protein
MIDDGVSSNVLHECFHQMALAGCMSNLIYLIWFGVTSGGCAILLAAEHARPTR